MKMFRARMTGVALLLTLSMGALAACGGSDSDGGTSDGAESTTSTTAPTTDAPETDSTSEGTGDKPSKDDVVDGYTKILTDQMGDGLPESIVDKVITCFVDEVYDDASAKTLQAIADSKPTDIDPSDASLFTDATTTCQKKVTADLTQ